MKEKIQEIKIAVEEQLKNTSSLEDLEALRIKYLGKKGELTAVLKGMGGLSAEERPIIGAMANEVRAFLEEEINTKKADIQKVLQNEKLRSYT